MPPSSAPPIEPVEFWRALVAPLLGSQPTPFYLFSCTPIQAALAELDRHLGHLPIRHWLSFKTQPLKPLIRWWRDAGRPVEVVSEFELLAALKEGLPPEHILANGPAKHHWLPRHPAPGLCVNLDSLAETQVLAPLARNLNWTLGLRLNTAEEVDPEHPAYPTQFGFTAEELPAALAILRSKELAPGIIHFHLRTNVASPTHYAKAIAQAAAMCKDAGVRPEVLDCGGGFPVPRVLTRGGKRLDSEFSLRAMAEVYAQGLKLFPSVREIWLENGRWLSARSGVLVVKVLDVKQRRGMRNLVCDGGRVTNALTSIWENHTLIPVPDRNGEECLTTVNGPTCMAFDQLARSPLPVSLQPGDHLIWLDAGAYHLPWETRFSHGLAPVLWHDGKAITEARSREGFDRWWGGWS